MLSRLPLLASRRFIAPVYFFILDIHFVELEQVSLAALLQKQKQHRIYIIIELRIEKQWILHLQKR